MYRSCARLHCIGSRPASKVARSAFVADQGTPYVGSPSSTLNVRRTSPPTVLQAATLGSEGNAPDLPSSEKELKKTRSHCSSNSRTITNSPSDAFAIKCFNYLSSSVLIFCGSVR